jgi:hypothetical protein
MLSASRVDARELQRDGCSLSVARGPFEGSSSAMEFPMPVREAISPAATGPLGSRPRMPPAKSTIGLVTFSMNLFSRRNGTRGEDAS